MKTEDILKLYSDYGKEKYDKVAEKPDYLYPKEYLLPQYTGDLYSSVSMIQLKGHETMSMEEAICCINQNSDFSVEDITYVRADTADLRGRIRPVRLNASEWFMMLQRSETDMLCQVAWKQVPQREKLVTQCRIVLQEYLNNKDKMPELLQQCSAWDEIEDFREEILKKTPLQDIAKTAISNGGCSIYVPITNSDQNYRFFDGLGYSTNMYAKKDEKGILFSVDGFSKAYTYQELGAMYLKIIEKEFPFTAEEKKILQETKPPVKRHRRGIEL